MQNINFSKLQNNITVASDEIKDIESVSVYVCANVGGRSESQELCGISHFLEHMAFKGTHKRTYKEIAEAVDNVGGIINA